MEYFIHNSADVSKEAKIGANTKIWHLSQVREGAEIGGNCIVGKNVYIDFGVSVGKKCKIQNNCSIYHGSKIEDGVFVGPHVVFTNDKLPRSIKKDGLLKENNDWVEAGVTVKYGASIGACSVLLPGVVVGKFAMVGAGSVVTKNVPDFGLVIGNPARLIGYVDEDGKMIRKV